MKESIASVSSPTALQAKTSKSEWWRVALGEYPTGIGIVASRGADGERVGMIVGSFAVVSENPPMVSFMATTASKTFLEIEQSGRFCVSILGNAHYDLCRSFTGSAAERFTVGEWTETADGSPRVADALVWFDADIAQIIPAGDHVIALGGVRDFGVGTREAGLPLLFLKGGYGTFATPSLPLDPRAMGLSVRQADAFRHLTEAVAEELGVLCCVGTVIHDSVVLLTAAGVNPGDTPMVGLSFPFAAPLAPVLAAWADNERRRVWEEGARHLLGIVDRPHLRRLLDSVRNRGYAVTAGEAPGDRFGRVVDDERSRLSDISDLWHDIDREVRERGEIDSHHVRSVQVPVFGPDAQAEHELYISGFDRPHSPESLEVVTRRAVQLAAQLTGILGGLIPDDYPRDFFVED